MSDKNIQAIPMAKKSASDQIENELGEHLSTSKITSEIDYLKKMKLRSYLQTHGASDEVKAIASFQSQDDKRKEQTYVKLIALYKAAEEEEKENKKERTKRNEMASIYATFGYEDLYSIACVISEIQRVKQSNKNVISIVDNVEAITT